MKIQSRRDLFSVEVDGVVSKQASFVERFRVYWVLAVMGVFWVVRIESGTADCMNDGY